MYKFNNNQLPTEISNMFTTLDNQKNKVTSGYLLPSVKTNYGKRFITFRGISSWKNIPSEIKERGTLSLFKKYYKIFLMKNQENLQNYNKNKIKFTYYNTIKEQSYKK